MKKKRRKSAELDAALRADPDYQDLARLLSRQSPEKKTRTRDYLSQLCGDSQEKGNAMTAEKKTALERIIELRNEGLSFQKIADRVNAEGFQNNAGNPFERTQVRKWFERARKKALQGSQPGEENQGGPETSQLAQPSPNAKPSQTCEPCEDRGETSTPVQSPEEPCEPCESSPVVLSDMTIADLRNLIREEIQSMTADIANYAIDAPDLPPPTPRKTGTKQYLGQRATLPGCRVDSVLYDLFEAQRRNLAISASELMQRILWAHFGKPHLSFESTASAEETTND